MGMEKEDMEKERGSIWRRWDLHLHTPGTLKNDNYAGTTLDESGIIITEQ